MDEQRAEHDLVRRLERALRLEQAILSLSIVDDQPYPTRVEHILREDSKALGIERVSYWSLRDHPPAIHCESLYLGASGRFESGVELPEPDYPGYFEAVRRGRPIVATDAQTDPATREFAASYLRPLGIGAMLDVPVYVRGHLVGVVCHEHVGGTRDFSEDEQMFAVAIGQQIALAIEARRREAAEAEVRASEARFRSIVEAAPIPTVVTSLVDGTCLYGNLALSQISGVPIADMVGKRSIDFYADPEERRRIVEELMRVGRVTARETQLKRADGSVYWALLSLVKLDFGGSPAIIASFHDLTPQKRLQEKLRVMALHDPLTGLANRALLLDRLRNEAARSARDPQYKFGVLYVDLDEFKSVNDRHGHEAGDKVLIEAANRLTNCVRATDTVGRVGGDEFVVLLAGIHHQDEAVHVARRIAEEIAAPIPIGEAELAIGASVGVAIGSGPKDPRDLLRSSDAAMYRAKQNGKPRVALAD